MADSGGDRRYAFLRIGRAFMVRLPAYWRGRLVCPGAWQRPHRLGECEGVIPGGSGTTGQDAAVHQKFHMGLHGQGSRYA